jgi:hypothetical protein
VKNFFFLIITGLMLTAQANAGAGIKLSKHHISQLQLKDLKAMAISGKVAEGWNKLSLMGDSYAAAAAEVIRPKTEWGFFSARLVRIHWINAAGEEAYKKYFVAVARQHFRQYVKLLSNGYFPNSREICISYRQAVLDHNLPLITVFDGAWIRSGFNRLARWEIFSQVSTARWANSNIFLDLDKNDAREIIEADFRELFSQSILPKAQNEED